MGDTASARALVSGVLIDLGLSESGWRVIDVAPARDVVGPPRTGLTLNVHLLITVGGPDDSFQVYATDGIEQAQADVATAEQVQDHAIELLDGAAVPPCPEHPHPLQAQVIDGSAMWVCPLDPEHYRSPVGQAR